jgi:uncharacterized RDD family membrane protein YckC
MERVGAHHHIGSLAKLILWPSPPEEITMTWYYADNGRQVGPVEESALDDLVRTGVVRDDTLVWREGMPNWQAHSAVRGVKPPPPMPAPAIGADTSYCSECGRPFPANQLVAIGNASVCAQCKPIYLQRVREGGQGIGVRRYGGFWIRFVARIIDGVILTVAAWIINIPLMLLIGGGSMLGSRSADALPLLIGAQGFLVLINIGLGIAYEVYFLTTKGATLGKQALGLKVIRGDGSGISTGVAIGRYFAQWVSGMILFIGYIMAAFDEEKRALHDRICDTRVVYAK